ncbi:flavodoxin family protein [Methanofollis fontis]|uniref:ArsR family transcriptional regulator n=1 Tax=Methanofollis fontis TaxID=2052832 RepID=A0A483CRU9_9EURY|nr:NAD(P)H-dependent oxidoreductase [Methanofollis fontis]TAJ45875.1 ArsR family transcriptional regulator [Methanofollis fontis]
MKTCIIYHSHSGTTRSVAEEVRDATGGDLIEVRLKEGHSSPVAYFLGLFRALTHGHNPIEPAQIDVSAADVIVIGTPVWTRRATPAITAAVDALEGGEGKRAVLFATCGAMAGDTLPALAGALTARGMRVDGEHVLTAADLRDGEAVKRLIADVMKTGEAP